MIVHNKWKGVVEEYGNMLNRTVVGWNPIRNNTHKLNGDWLWLENTLKDCLLLLCLGFSVAAFYLGLNFWKKRERDRQAGCSFCSLKKINKYPLGFQIW